MSDSDVGMPHNKDQNSPKYRTYPRENRQSGRVLATVDELDFEMDVSGVFSGDCGERRAGGDVAFRKPVCDVLLCIRTDATWGD